MVINGVIIPHIFVFLLIIYNGIYMEYKWGFHGINGKRHMRLMGLSNLWDYDGQHLSFLIEFSQPKL
jgi:hypothetical protein